MTWRWVRRVEGVTAAAEVKVSVGPGPAVRSAVRLRTLRSPHNAAWKWEETLGRAEPSPRPDGFLLARAFRLNTLHTHAAKPPWPWYTLGTVMSPQQRSFPCFTAGFFAFFIPLLCCLVCFYLQKGAKAFGCWFEYGSVRQAPWGY